MNKEIQHIHADLIHLGEDAESLVKTARESIGETIDSATIQVDGYCDRTNEAIRSMGHWISGCNRAVKSEVRTHSFRYLAITAGISVLIGYLMASRCASNPSSLE